jgi:hypothetical protein
MSTIIAGRSAPERIKYEPGKPLSVERLARVHEMQRGLTRVRRYMNRGGLSWRVTAYLIWHEYEVHEIRRPKVSAREKQPGPLVPPLDLDLRKLAEVRENARIYLRRPAQPPPAATDVEIAVEVAARYRHDEPAVRVAVQRLERLVSEASEWEFVHLGSPTGRRQLPPARESPEPRPLVVPMTVDEYRAARAARGQL